MSLLVLLLFTSLMSGLIIYLAMKWNVVDQLEKDLVNSTKTAYAEYEKLGNELLTVRGLLIDRDIEHEDAWHIYRRDERFINCLDGAVYEALIAIKDRDESIDLLLKELEEAVKNS
jgi:hypothetical protein